ncbi:MAG: TerB family tellurite resistance protein [Planctomycetota bacterium]
MQLDTTAKMRLLEFVCSFAWTDLEVQQAERDLIMLVVGRMGLGAREAAVVKGWLALPPPAEDVDPTAIPSEHREAFFEAAVAVARADGRVVPAERDQLALFRDLLQD